MSKHCMEMSWAFKTDDDMMLNIDAFSDYLTSVNEHDREKLHCHLWKDAPILRDSDNKTDPKFQVLSSKICK